MGVKRAAEIIEMTPNETRLVNFVWTNSEDLATGESLSTASVADISPAGSLTATGTTINGEIVQITVASGSENVNYVVTMTTTTTAGQVLEGEGLFIVRD